MSLVLFLIIQEWMHTVAERNQKKMKKKKKKQNTKQNPRGLLTVARSQRWSSIKGALVSSDGHAVFHFVIIQLILSAF